MDLTLFILFLIIVWVGIQITKSIASKISEDMGEIIDILDIMEQDFSKSDRLEYKKLVNKFRTKQSNPNISSGFYLSRVAANNDLKEAAEDLKQFFYYKGGRKKTN
jgi:inactivated superfamily I helicase